MDDVFIAGLTDLFGDPIPKSRGGRGRPAHVPTAEFRRFVQLSLACGRDEIEIAAALRITTRTLNRHYFHELRGKASARLRLRMKNLDAILTQVEAGKPAAMALLSKEIDRLDKREAAAKYQQPAPGSTKEPFVGVKESRKVAAAQVKGKFAPPAPPAALLN